MRPDSSTAGRPTNHCRIPTPTPMPFTSIPRKSSGWVDYLRRIVRCSRPSIGSCHPARVSHWDAKHCRSSRRHPVFPLCGVRIAKTNRHSTCIWTESWWIFPPDNTRSASCSRKSSIWNDTNWNSTSVSAAVRPHLLLARVNWRTRTTLIDK